MLEQAKNDQKKKKERERKKEWYLIKGGSISINTQDSKKKEEGHQNLRNKDTGKNSKSPLNY